MIDSLASGDCVGVAFAMSWTDTERMGRVGC